MSLAVFTREHGEKNCDQAAHNVGIAVARKRQYRSIGTVWANIGIEPDLARAAQHLVGIVMRSRGQRRQFAPQFDQITIAIVPIFEDAKLSMISSISAIAESFLVTFI